MRASGILLPIFSLPGRYGIGRFSAEAYAFADFLQAAGQRYWQILPIGPTGYGDSPYQSFSTFAINPYFADLEELVRQGLLTAEELAAADFGGDTGNIDYGRLYTENSRLLDLAAGRAIRHAEPYGHSHDSAFRQFREENAHWLEDYALFTAVKAAFQGRSFPEWDEDIRRREPAAMQKWSGILREEIEKCCWIQYECARQWFALKAGINKKGIQIIGDIPIYVSPDSADFWACPELFQTAADGSPAAVAGCPPDGFSADGQFWGNPLYDWARHQGDGYRWWIRRLSHCRRLYDVIRIDHFRGFDEYYAIPAGERTAAHGRWEKGPGLDLFRAVQEALGEIPIIAEDLGYMTDSVRQLVRETGFPNMKVLEFAFDSRDSSSRDLYLPYNYTPNCVVYTGTHDNETICGWLDSILPEEKQQVQDYLGCPSADRQILTREMIRLAQSSAANLCVIPMQDWLGLDNHARINTPNTMGANWGWRMPAEACTPALAERIRKISGMYGRRPPWPQ